MSNPISETSDNNVIDNIIQQINTEGQNNNNNNELQLDPNNTPKAPTFDLNQSNNRIMNFVNNFKSSIIVGIIIVLFSFPQINKLGKVAEII